MDQDTSRAAFCVWLKVAAAHAGAADEVQLSRMLVDNGCYCTPSTVAAWLAGTQEPSPEKARLLLVALNAATPDIDVWEQYGRWKNGDTFFDESGASEEPPDEPSLSDVVEASGLPPPLAD